MQSAHQSILEYTYQYTIAERTQERLSEICYTMFVTITSTLLVMGATWGLNKAFAGVEANVYANAASKSLTKFGESSKAYRAISSMADQALKTSGRSLAFNMFKVTCAVITETLEELYVDPMIEAYVTNKVKDMGGSEISQILWSGLAESGREQFLSSVTSFMRAGFRGRTQVDTNIQLQSQNIQDSIQSIEQITQATQEAKAQQQLRQEYLKEGISTILMFAGAMAGGFGGSIGTALGNIMMIAGTSVEGIDFIKDMFEVVLKKDQLDISVETITLSDEQKAPFTEYKFRISVLPMQTGLRVIEVDPTQKIADLIKEHFPSEVPQGSLFYYKGKLLDEFRSLLEYSVDPKNPIYVVPPMAAMGDLTGIEGDPIFLQILRKFDWMLKEYISELPDFSSESLEYYNKFVDYAIPRLAPGDIFFSPKMKMLLEGHAEKVLKRARLDLEIKTIQENKGKYLLEVLCEVYECSISELETKFKSSFKNDFDKLLNPEEKVSFNFLAEIYRRAAKDFNSDQRSSAIFKVLRIYNPAFSVFFIATRGKTNTLERSDYLENTEKYFEEYNKQTLIRFKQAKGNVRSIKAINKYCTLPNAMWESPKIAAVQSDLLSELWDGRDAHTGKPLSTVVRHHYTIIYWDGNKVGYIKYDCRLVALVPLSQSSHLKMLTSSAEAIREYEANFKGVMESLMKGVWAVPEWWRKLPGGVDNIKSFEDNLIRLGFVKPT